ncbi:MAG: 3,4-dihydroxy-2-butanone-4-phosphate synthase [Deltaproteobacteria bacterium]|nr:3,4-dihydroxy-2-butanone-4-phosphate synthase [Deltaproteobacteria bacterium]
MSEKLENMAAFLEAYRKRRIAVLWDDSSVAGRAVLISPAQDISASCVNTLVALTGGLPFVAVTPTRATAFMLSKMSRPALHPSPQSQLSDDYLNICVSVEAREGVSTGISAADRAATIRVLGEEQPNPRKLVKPGHIFPVETRSGGVLVKNALPEGACDISRISGYTDAAVFLDLLDVRGDFLAPHGQEQLCAANDIPRIALSELTRYRLSSESLVHRIAEAKLPTQLAGELRSLIFKSSIHEGEHLALIKGEIDPDKPVLTRVQTEFTFADVFGGSTPPSRSTLHRALKAIGDNGSGVLVYLRRPSFGELCRQISDSAVSQKPAAIMRDYGLGAQILRDLGVRKVELLTGSKKNLVGIRPFGIEIVSQREIPNEKDT